MVLDYFLFDKVVMVQQLVRSQTNTKILMNIIHIQTQTTAAYFHGYLSNRPQFILNVF